LVSGRYLHGLSALSWWVVGGALGIAAIAVLLGLRAHVYWEAYVLSLTEHGEPAAFPALLDALYRTEQLTVTRPDAAERIDRLMDRILASVRWHLGRPERLADVRLTASQQERLHMALMSDHRELVRAVLQALPFLADDESAVYVGKLASGSWAAEHDADIRLAAVRMLPSLAGR
jgi:hypothetical protein